MDKLHRFYDLCISVALLYGGASYFFEHLKLKTLESKALAQNHRRNQKIETSCPPSSKYTKNRLFDNISFIILLCLKSILLYGVEHLSASKHSLVQSCEIEV